MDACLFFGPQCLPSKLLTLHPKLEANVSFGHSPFSLGKPPRISNSESRRNKGELQKKFVPRSQNGTGGMNHWEKWIPKDFFAANKVFGAIAGITSSPIAQYISSPTILHKVDPRIKMVWLFALVFFPAKSGMAVRLGVVIFLGLLSMWVQPIDVWKDQLGRVTLLCGVLFVLLALTTDSAPSLLSSRSPPPSVSGLPALPTSFEGYKYVIMKFGPFQVTRKSLAASTTAACLTFTIFQSASLCLTTTMSEQLAFSLRWFLSPFTKLGAPMDEVVLAVLLSLRFINLVFDEVRSVSLAIVSRRIEWQLLTKLETIDVFFTFLGRIFKNLYNHTNQITQAMIVRGFRGNCDEHKILLSAGSSSQIANIFSVSSLLALIFISRYFCN